jgi:hypothetical protein
MAYQSKIDVSFSVFVNFTVANADDKQRKAHG